MVFSWRPVLVSTAVLVAATALAGMMSALMAMTSDVSFAYAFWKQLPAFLAGMLSAGVWCGCLLSYGMGVLAGYRQASANAPTPPRSGGMVDPAAPTGGEVLSEL